MQESKQTLDDLKVSLDRVTEKMHKVADFFCQETKKFKLEELFVDLLSFLRELENAQKVWCCKALFFNLTSWEVGGLKAKGWSPPS